MNKAIIVVIVVIVSLLGVGYYFTKNTQKEMQKNQPSEPTQTESDSSAPGLTIDKSKKYTAFLKTSEGDITVELFATKTRSGRQNCRSSNRIKPNERRKLCPSKSC